MLFYDYIPPVSQVLTNVYEYHSHWQVNFMVGAFYDAVWLYGLAVNETLDAGGDLRDGLNVSHTMWDRYFSGKYTLCRMSVVLQLYPSRWRPILQVISCSAHLHDISCHHTYGSIYIHRSAPHSHALFQGHASKCFRHMSNTFVLYYTWLAYLREEHAMLILIELSLRRLNIIEHPC